MPNATVRVLSLIVAFTGLSSVTYAGEIHEAAIDGHIDRLIELIDEGVDVNAPDDAGSPLQWALFGRQFEAARLLLERGADPNVQGPGGSALSAAVTAGDAGIVALLLEHGADPNLGDKRKPLIVAAKNGKVELVDLLLEHGASATAATPDKMTALHEAAKSGHLGVSALLLEHGADVNALTSSGRPAIHYALLYNHLDLADILKKKGARPGPVSPISQFLASADLKKGEEEAGVCFRCHALDKVTTGFVGPHLRDVVGRPRGAVPGFPYSPALARLDGNWDFEALNAFVARTTEVAPGTKMDFAGIPEPERRANLIAYLRSLNDNPVPLPE
ncbi:MAG: ankyrin repeat domain-containing protein [Kiloniellales bacterium]|nr:ankyrin repeat domain-containing protein [Kiloniellales bacterium]